MPRKVKVTNIEQDREEPVEVDATAEPEEYGQVVKDLKAEDSGEIEGLEDFVIPPAGYEAPSDKVTGKERAKKPRAKKAASAPATVIEAIEELKDDEPEVVEEPVKKVTNTRKKNKVEELAAEPMVESKKEEMVAPPADVERAKNVVEKVTCENCGKCLTARSLKYTHSKACRARVSEPNEDLQAPPVPELVRQVNPRMERLKRREEHFETLFAVAV